MARLSSLTVTVGLLMAALSAAGAQLTGRHAGGAEFAPIDASALGDTRPASIALFSGEEGIGIGAGWGVHRGALRGYLGAGAYRLSLGGGYARTLAKRRLTGP